MLAVTILEIFGILGVIVVAILAIGVTFVAYHIWKFKRAIKQLGTSFQEMSETFKEGVVPTSLGLEETDDEAIEENAELRSAVEQFEAAGLRRGGVYTMAKLPGALVVTLADPIRGVCASAGAVPNFGVNLDVVTMYEDGGALTHRTLKSLGLEQPPHMPNVVMEGAAPAELLDAHLRGRDPSKQPRAIAPEDVADAMDEYTAAVAKWRDERGGLNEDEVRRNLQIMGTAADEASIKMVVAASRIESEERAKPKE